MRRMVYFLFLAVFCCISLSGCMRQVTIGKPEIRDVSYEWGEVTSATTEIITRVRVYNPNPIPLPLKDILSEVYMADIKMGEGAALKADIKANSESTIVISTELENAKIPQWWVSHIRNNERSTIRAIANLTFDLKVTDFKYPFETSRPLETNMLAWLSSGKPQDVTAGPVTLTLGPIESHWGDISENNTEILTTVTIFNDNPYPISITELSYSIELNGIMIIQGSISELTILNPQSETAVTITAKLDNSMLDDWWVSHIEGGERTQGTTTIKPVIEFLGEEFPITLVEEKFEFTTDLLKG